jgi:hypothetical protein
MPTDPGDRTLGSTAKTRLEEFCAMAKDDDKWGPGADNLMSWKGDRPLDKLSAVEQELMDYANYCDFVGAAKTKLRLKLIATDSLCLRSNERW